MPVYKFAKFDGWRCWCRLETAQLQLASTWIHVHS